VIITKIEAFGYRCLREVRQALGPYQILVGPNGSGKSVFLDAIAFLGDLVYGGLQRAVSLRTENFYDLVWGRKNESFRLAVEAESAREDDSPDLIRYEIGARINANDGLIELSDTRLTVSGAPALTGSAGRFSFFPESGDSRPEIVELGSDLAALSLVRDPRVRRLARLLMGGITKIALDNRSLRAPSRPGGGRAAVHDGSRLARMVEQVRDSSSAVLRGWLEHVRTAIPDIADIRIVERPEDRHRYLMVQYPGGVEVPQWMLSDGTLRLLALTILAYLPDFHGVYLIEEPEVGVHPTAIETIMQSLSSVYEGQVLVTSHSPIVLGLARPDQMLCFQKNESGTTIIPGNEHPILREWRSGVNVSDLFAAGVLG